MKIIPNKVTFCVFLLGDTVQAKAVTIYFFCPNQDTLGLTNVKMDRMPVKCPCLVPVRWLYDHRVDNHPQCSPGRSSCQAMWLRRGNVRIELVLITTSELFQYCLEKIRLLFVKSSPSETLKLKLKSPVYLLFLFQSF